MISQHRNHQCTITLAIARRDYIWGRFCQVRWWFRACLERNQLTHPAKRKDTIVLHLNNLTYSIIFILTNQKPGEVYKTKQNQTKQNQNKNKQTETYHHHHQQHFLTFCVHFILKRSFALIGSMCLAGSFYVFSIKYD